MLLALQPRALSGPPTWTVIIAITLTLYAYLLPTLIANFRGHRNVFAIAALNLLLGWSLIGWVVALVWALTRGHSGRAASGDHRKVSRGRLVVTRIRNPVLSGVGDIVAVKASGFGLRAACYAGSRYTFQEILIFMVGAPIFLGVLVTLVWWMVSSLGWKWTGFVLVPPLVIGVVLRMLGGLLPMTEVPPCPAKVCRRRCHFHAEGFASWCESNQSSSNRASFFRCRCGSVLSVTLGELGGKLAFVLAHVLKTDGFLHPYAARETFRTWVPATGTPISLPRPLCCNGLCHAGKYEMIGTVKVESDIKHFGDGNFELLGCSCGDLFVTNETEWWSLGTDGDWVPYMCRNADGVWIKQEASTTTAPDEVTLILFKSDRASARRIVALW
jgi:hypothetical protein